MTALNSIEIEQLEKRYGAYTVLHQITLRLEGGVLFCLLGPNGAGKTTMLQVITGLRRIDAGTVRINGVPIHSREFRSVRHMIGYMPEQPTLYDHLTGREFLYMLAQLYGVDRTRLTTVESLFGALDLAAHADRLMRGYSLGTRKKIAFLGAIIHDPAILILDEPTSGMDAASARIVKDLMRQAVSEGKLVIFTTHVMELAEHLAGRVGILSGGNIISDGSPTELREQYGKHPTETLENIFLRLTAIGGEMPTTVT